MRLAFGAVSGFDIMRASDEIALEMIGWGVG